MTGTPWTPGIASVGSPTGVSLVDGATFVVSAPNGDVCADQPEGFFTRDTRFLSRLVITVDDQPLTLVSSVPRGPFSTSIVTRAHPSAHAHIEDPPVTVIRHRVLGHGLREELDIRNHAIHPVDAILTIEIDADFASLFDVKSGVQDPSRSAQVESYPEAGGDLRLAPDPELGLPAGTATDVAFDPPPLELSGHRGSWRLALSPGGRATITVDVTTSTGHGDDEMSPPTHDSMAAVEVRAAASSAWSAATFQSADRRMDRVAAQSLHDLAVLRIFDPAHADRMVVAAGAPWFMALFGRDSILTAWMALIADHRLAAGVLQALAELQGRAEVAATDEQPGRILHEVRYDQRSVGLLGGSNVYYGTVDATPLFVMLVAEYLRWTDDRTLVDELRPAVEQALEWIDVYGDRDGDGFVEYQRSVETGLINQGWKDSWDGVRFADGRVAEPPIALCEVQGYVYGAYRAKAYLDRIWGDRASAESWDRRADELRRAFNKAFWLDRRNSFAIGLDGEKRPIDSVTSNVGHCLWTGIVADERADRVAKTLASPAMSTGWGLRTLTVENPAFNPLSYHCGSVWPHDTAIAVAGLERYGFAEEAERLRSGLLDAGVALGGRLPELFAGFDRAELPHPVAYPASCAPQAWAAGAGLLLIRSMLRLDPDLPNGRVRVAPRLGTEAQLLRAEGIPLGRSSLTVNADRQEILVTGLDPAVELIRS